VNINTIRITEEFMDFQEMILSRRSIRKYINKAIPKEDITKMLEAAMAAPSAVAKDPWFFFVVAKRVLLDELAEVLPHGKMLKQAPAAVLVCGDMDKTYLGNEGEKGYLVQDCSAAVENLMLSATGLGIGSVWLGVYPRKDRMEGISRLFKLDKSRVPVAVVSLGYPGETRPAGSRFSDDKVSWIE
jgi:nitroreductase